MVQVSDPMGPLCQSCAMPFTRPEEFGPTAEGFRQNDYCVYRFGIGTFTAPNATMEEIIDFNTKMVAERMGEAQARTLMEATIPRLKR